MVTIATRDGRPVRVRHMRPEDGVLLERMFYHLSSETRYRRFFMPLDHIDPARVRQEAQRLAQIHPKRELALIALAKESGSDECIAVTRYGRIPNTLHACEGSIVVRDDYQRSGVGRQLFDLLIQSAMARGMQHMSLLTHADNAAMIALVQRLGLPYHGRHSVDLYEMDVQLTDGNKPFFPFTAP
ncbi:MAG: GNAT family N-acetyltransferase [Candidatus Viridilinea halotolerans]|uniref:GNAT family N-acetyltransferase n=1 Tax=Candidatus Viridilinea halotolerans TaxID=2491704 RepID=A0A426TVS2_9CHLR|nr:MAG: GNAT family N-acetyltransferase [Candidatus Viridilinea halotolerans]